MKYRAGLITLCVVFFSLVGCDREATPFTVGPFDVNSDTGVATGNALGVDFAVAGASGARLESGPGKVPGSGRAGITLADDLKIDLEMAEGGETITFLMNGKEFGDLEKGDKVEIDQARNVKVNDTARQSRD